MEKDALADLHAAMAAAQARFDEETGEALARLAEDFRAVSAAFAAALREAISIMQAASTRMNAEFEARQHELSALRSGGSNVRPAPFFLNEKTVRDLIEGGQPASFRHRVPVEPTKLVDRPRRSEDPRLARANEDFTGEPESDPLIEPAPEPAPSPDLDDAPAPGEFGTPDHLSQWGETPEDEEAQRAIERAYAGEANQPRRCDGFYRQAKDRDARELERPVEEVVAESSRIDVIRAAARKLQKAEPADRGDDGNPSRAEAIRVAARSRHKPVQRASEKRETGLTPRREAKALPPLPFELRRARFQAAEAFLKQRGVLVTVRDRAAQIRTYRVTGAKEALLAEQVIELAIAKGLDV